MIIGCRSRNSIKWNQVLKIQENHHYSYLSLQLVITNGRNSILQYNIEMESICGKNSDNVDCHKAIAFMQMEGIWLQNTISKRVGVNILIEYGRDVDAYQSVKSCGLDSIYANYAIYADPTINVTCGTILPLLLMCNTYFQDFIYKILFYFIIISDFTT